MTPNADCYVYPVGKLYLNSHLNWIFTIRWNNIRKNLLNTKKNPNGMYIAAVTFCNL